jgi:hypothetical protein
LFRSVTGLLLSKNGNSKQAGGPGHLVRPRQENRYRMSGKTTIIQRALRWTRNQWHEVKDGILLKHKQILASYDTLSAESGNLVG